jgi:hypothetical protein
VFCTQNVKHQSANYIAEKFEAIQKQYFLVIASPSAVFSVKSKVSNQITRNTNFGAVPARNDKNFVFTATKQTPR